MPRATESGEITAVPADHSRWDELRAAFGRCDDLSRCHCERFQMLPRESPAAAEELAVRLRRQGGDGHPRSQATSGRVVYLAAEPAGWCAVV